MSGPKSFILITIGTTEKLGSGNNSSWVIGTWDLSEKGGSLTEEGGFQVVGRMEEMCMSCDEGMDI